MQIWRHPKEKAIRKVLQAAAVACRTAVNGVAPEVPIAAPIVANEYLEFTSPVHVEVKEWKPLLGASWKFPEEKRAQKSVTFEKSQWIFSVNEDEVFVWVDGQDIKYRLLGATSGFEGVVKHSPNGRITLKKSKDQNWIEPELLSEFWKHFDQNFEMSNRKITLKLAVMDGEVVRLKSSSEKPALAAASPISSDSDGIWV